MNNDTLWIDKGWKGGKIFVISASVSIIEFPADFGIVSAG